MEANIVYLQEEIKNHQERLQLMEKYLKDYPAISVYKRKISGNIYYYAKFWKNGKSISKFLCKNENEYQREMKKIEATNKKRQIIKNQLQETKDAIKALKKQLQIANKAYKNV